MSRLDGLRRGRWGCRSNGALLNNLRHSTSHASHTAHGSKSLMLLVWAGIGRWMPITLLLSVVLLLNLLLRRRWWWVVLLLLMLNVLAIVLVGPTGRRSHASLRRGTTMTRRSRRSLTHRRWWWHNCRLWWLSIIVLADGRRRRHSVVMSSHRTSREWGRNLSLVQGTCPRCGCRPLCSIRMGHNGRIIPVANALALRRRKLGRRYSFHRWCRLLVRVGLGRDTRCSIR